MKGIKLTYVIWDNSIDNYVNPSGSDVVCLPDGRVGFIDTTGRFVEEPNWVVKYISSMEVK